MSDIHSELFSPSSMSRRVVCRGSGIKESTYEKLFPEEPADYRDWGRFAHDIIYKLNTGRIKSLKRMKGKEAHGQVCDDEMIQCVRQFARDTAEISPEFCEAKYEKKVSLKWLGYPDVFGTADVQFFELFGRLVVLDYKGGEGLYVSVKGNIQLFIYALGALNGDIELYKEIIIAVSQPRNTGGTDKSLRWISITPAELIEWFRKELEPTLIAMENGDVTLNPTVEGCQFCKAKDICEAFTASSLALIEVEPTEPVTIEPEFKPPTVNEDLVIRAYPHIKLFRSWLKRIEKKAAEMVAAGEYPGYKMVSGRNSREWNDEKLAAETIKAAGGDPYVTALVSVAAAEKISAPVRKAVQGLVKKIPGGATIVREHDPRPSLTLGEASGLAPLKTKEDN